LQKIVQRLDACFDNRANHLPLRRQGGGDLSGQGRFDLETDCGSGRHGEVYSPYIRLTLRLPVKSSYAMKLVQWAPNLHNLSYESCGKVFPRLQ
jgi:hypothetical protein